MKIQNPILIVSVFSIITLSCKSSKKLEDSALPVTIYKMEKGACFGTCPIFTLEIDQNGFVYLDAKKYNKINGKLERQLSKEEYDLLKTSFKKANLFNLLDVYPSNVADLPSIKLSHTKDGKIKTVKANEKMPESFENLITVMDGIVQKDGWILIEKYEIEEELKKEDTNIYSEIIVSFKSGVRLPQWFKDNEANTIRLMKAVNAETNTWLVTYDKMKFEPFIMLDKLKKDAAVSNAEFNKKITNR